MEAVIERVILMIQVSDGTRRGIMARTNMSRKLSVEDIEVDSLSLL